MAADANMNPPTSSITGRLHPLGRTGRRTYAKWGFGLVAFKLTVDRIIATALGADYWGWLSYWIPPGAGLNEHGFRQSILLLILAAVALPFVVVGVLLTLRRLRDAGASLWLGLVFFVPALNVVMFILLCFLPSHDRVPDRAARRGIPGWLTRTLALRSRALSAAVAIVLTVLLIVPMTWLATVFFRNYGWGIFVAMPCLLGFVAVMIHAAPEPRTLPEGIAVAMLALLFSGLMILAVALEGLLCLLMALPLAAPLVVLGAFVGHCLQRSWWDRNEPAPRLYAVAWLALPFALMGEPAPGPELQTLAATTSIEIAAPPAAVWRQVVAFSELPPPQELVFRSGIAYPMRATLAGRGVGAVRRCEFSTGPFVEPITVWDENRRLGFDVSEQPHPMHELSPYRALHPPHLDGFFRSRRGEFRLTALPGGRTRLEGTTWYTQKLWPGRYWQLWSDYLLHTIHNRVLAHIRAEAERSVIIR